MGNTCSRFLSREDEDVATGDNKAKAASASAITSSMILRHDACVDKSSVYYDAKQSMSESMMGPYIPATLPEYVPRGSVVMEEPETLLRESDFGKKRRQTIILKYDLQEPQIKVEQRGYPGNLTGEELESCLEFRRILKEDEAKREMVGCFTVKGIEEEPYALCRFLRGRNFNTEDTLEMIEQSMSSWAVFKEHDFYPTIEDAVGCTGSVLLTQYPYLFSGNAKNGCPLNYQMLGRVKMEGVACVTELERLPNYVMHSIMNQFSEQVRAAQQKDSTRLVRCECIAVIDLKGLDSSQLNKTTLGALKGISKATGCFPEMLNRMIVLNASYTFSFFWTMIKAFLEARTAAKIEIYTNEKKGKQRLLELVDKNDLLSDYGGTGPSFDELAQKCGNESGASRQTSELMNLNGKLQTIVELTKNEKVSVSVYTSSEGEVSLLQDKKVIKTVEVTRPEGDSSSSPFCTKIIAEEAGPGKLSVTAKSGPTSNSADYILVYAEVFPLA